MTKENGKLIFDRGYKIEIWCNSHGLSTISYSAEVRSSKEEYVCGLGGRDTISELLRDVELRIDQEVTQ